eukprot:scaffold24642_cov68-Cyclotella_meneghiniana.AAC.2
MMDRDVVDNFASESVQIRTSKSSVDKIGQPSSNECSGWAGEGLSGGLTFMTPVTGPRTP